MRNQKVTRGQPSFLFYRHLGILVLLLLVAHLLHFVARMFWNASSHPKATLTYNEGVLQQATNVENACRKFEEALRICPFHFPSAFQLGEIFWEKGDKKLALFAYKTAVEIGEMQVLGDPSIRENWEKSRQRWKELDPDSFL